VADPVSVSTTVAAPAEVVWSLVSDLTQMGSYSPENEGVEWLRGATGPAVGVTFRGANRRGSKSWSTHGRITEATPNRALEFVITAVGFKVATWRYILEPTDGGCTVTETWIDQRGPVPRALGKLVTGVDDRATHNRATMAATLENLRVAAERAATAR
jgi:uncharacterized protein YndB with AHSA1/START domain